MKSEACENLTLSSPPLCANSNALLIAENMIDYTTESDLNIRQRSFFRAYRDFLFSDEVKSLDDKQFRILYNLLGLAAYRTTKHNIQGKLISLNPGQLCYSLRELADKLNVGLQSLRGSVKYFVECGFLTQNATHGKTILTFTLPGVYDANENLNNTKRNTSATQEQHTNIESIRKKKNISLEESPPKKTKALTKYGNVIEMSESQYALLCDEFGKPAVDAKIADGDTWYEKTGVRRKRYSVEIRQWLTKDKASPPKLVNQWSEAAQLVKVVERKNDSESYVTMDHDGIECSHRGERTTLLRNDDRLMEKLREQLVKMGRING